MKRIGIYLSFASFFLAMTLILPSFLRIAAQNKTVLPAAGSQNSPVIILDAGHGGMDGGAISPGGVAEKDLNLAMTRILADYFRAAGYQVIETRSTDRMLCEENTAVGHKKRTDLANRVKSAEAYPDSLLISIHMNTYPSSSCRGLQVWYSPNNADSAVYAQAVQDGVRNLLQPENKRKTKSATSAIYLLYRVKNPAILIECGFLTNPEDCSNLQDEAYQHSLALAIFASVSGKMNMQT